MIRNDGTPDEKKFLGITPHKIRVPDNQYIDYIWDPTFLQAGINYGDRIQTKDMPAHYQNLPILYKHYTPERWVEQKREQLYEQLGLVSYIIVFIGLHWQGYRIAEYSEWTYMLKWLLNPEYYYINELSNESIIRNSEYMQYYCKMHGKPYPCDSLKIDYFNSESFYFQEKDVIIDFSDFNNNCEYMQQVFQVLNSLLK
ncbi:hypothetical protein GLOIN_2v1489014 [Rhizophagus clarus]|nr:hypothetical protein GLOIN_2v1489014 [Rhizophagus clarus]